MNPPPTKKPPLPSHPCHPWLVLPSASLPAKGKHGRDGGIRKPVDRQATPQPLRSPSKKVARKKSSKKRRGNRWHLGFPQSPGVCVSRGAFIFANLGAGVGVGGVYGHSLSKIF